MMIMIILLKLLSENLQASPEKINPPPSTNSKSTSPPFFDKIFSPPLCRKGGGHC